MWECVNVIVGLIGMVERGESWNRKGSPRDRRRTTEGSPTFELKISNLPSCMTRVRNALVFKRYIIATKKAHRTHEEGRKNVGMRYCVCSSPLHLAALTSQAVSPMEPGRMRK